MPMTIELLLVDDFADAVVSYFPTPVAGKENIAAANTIFEDWAIENCEIKVDLCTLDNALDNSYANHLMQGKSLPINYSTFVSQMQAVSGPSLAVNVARALTRLKSVLVTFEKDQTAANGRAWSFSKLWTNFFSPMSFENQFGVYRQDEEGEFEFQLQIGSKLYPEYPIRSHAEAYYQLRKMMGVLSSSVHNFDINIRDYRDDKMILAIDTEKVLDAGWTGLNTRAGDLMRIKFTLRDQNDPTRQPDRMHVVLHSDQIMEIKDGGVQIFD